MDTLDRATWIADALADHGVGKVDVHAVLGSGLGGVAEALAEPVRVPFDAVEGLPRSTVPGHAGAFHYGRLGAVRVLVQSGRVHLYEGHDPREATLSVRAAARLGARVLFLTNAAGSLRPDRPVGGWMRIADQIDLQGEPALLPGERGSGSPWCADLGARVDRFARARGLDWPSGVYAGLVGPTYETPGEVRALRSFGADAVGMSTVKEAAVGWAAGLRVAGLSCLTNLAAGLSSGALSHEEVVAAGAVAARELAAHLPDLLVDLVDAAE